MQTYEIVLTRRAKEDIVDIGDYVSYTLMEPEIAYSFVKGLRKSITKLKDMPYRYGKITDEVLSSQGIHCMPYKNYYILYEIIEIKKMVIVLRIGYRG